MINTNTVFILGAGASAPYGYPTGKQLRAEICSTFLKKYGKFDFKELSAPSIFTLSGENASQFTRAFKNSSTQSIDLFLARNQEYLEIGKVAVTLSILQAEGSSVFREDIKNQDHDWYSHLFHRMTRSLIDPDSYKHFGDNKVTFITFNYDRSLEHFFYESLRNSFSKATDSDIINELKMIPIHHVHGKVADLPWENGKNVDYKKHGADPYGSHLPLFQELSSNIRIVHEPGQHNRADIHVAISNADKIFFLGLGYADENMEILKFNRNLHNKPQVFGTALGLLEKEITDIKNAMCSNSDNDPVLWNNIHIINTDCVSLLRQFL